MRLIHILGIILAVLVVGIASAAVLTSGESAGQAAQITGQKSTEVVKFAKPGDPLIFPYNVKNKPKALSTPSATPASTPAPTPVATPTAPSQIITYTSRQFLVGKPIDPYEKCLNSAKFYKLQTGKEYPVDCSQYKTGSGSSTTGGSSSQSGTPLLTSSLGLKTGGTSLTMGTTVSGGNTGTSSGFGASLVSSSSFKSGGLGVQSGSMMSSAGTYSGSTSFNSFM
jgi:hypothetical protein